MFNNILNDMTINKITQFKPIVKKSELHCLAEDALGCNWHFGVGTVPFEVGTDEKPQTVYQHCMWFDYDPDNFNKIYPLMRACNPETMLALLKELDDNRFEIESLKRQLSERTN